MREPKPNEVTHICCFITGDRFYFINDSKKEVWQLRYHTMIKVRTAFKKFSVCKNDSGNEQRFDANRVVVFLRRTQQPLKKREKEFLIEKYFA
jgi:hypothetical protein